MPCPGKTAPNSSLAPPQAPLRSEGSGFLTPSRFSRLQITLQGRKGRQLALTGRWKLSCNDTCFSLQSNGLLQEMVAIASPHIASAVDRKGRVLGRSAEYMRWRTCLGCKAANSKKLPRCQFKNRWHLPCYWLPFHLCPCPACKSRARCRWCRVPASARIHRTRSGFHWF